MKSKLKDLKQRAKLLTDTDAVEKYEMKTYDSISDRFKTSSCNFISRPCVLILAVIIVIMSLSSAGEQIAMIKTYENVGEIEYPSSELKILNVNRFTMNGIV